jgi:hypothetical protein
VAWSVNHLGFNDYYGLFGSVSGSAGARSTNPAAAKVTATIPVSKVLTASAGLTAHLLRPGADGKKPDFFGPTPADATLPPGDAGRRRHQRTWPAISRSMA